MNGKKYIYIYTYTYTHTQMLEYYPPVNRNEILLFVIHNGLENKRNKSHRERQILYGFTYMWNLKNKQVNTYN